MKKQTYNVTRDIKDVVNNISKEVGFPTSKDDKKSDEAIQKYIVENNVVGIQRGTKKKHNNINCQKHPSA